MSAWATSERPEPFDASESRFKPKQDSPRPPPSRSLLLRTIIVKFLNRGRGEEAAKAGGLCQNTCPFLKHPKGGRNTLKRRDL